MSGRRGFGHGLGERAGFGWIEVHFSSPIRIDLIYT